MIFDRDRSHPIATSIEIPQAILDIWIPRKNQIVMVEAIALPIAAATFAEALKDKMVLWMIDSDSVLGAMVKGYSDREDICSTAGIFWQQMREMGVDVYLDRIPTDGNLSDGPSRGFWATAMKAGWRIVPAVIPDELKMK